MIRRRLLPIEILVFVVGAASLGGEIAATRLLAPWFGESTIVWANTIATVLVALSVGYAVGGRIADRRPDPGILSVIVLGAGRSEEHTSELQSRFELVCRLLLAKKNR